MSIKTFHKKLLLAFLTPILFFGLLELTLRMLHIEVNTGEGPIQKKVSFLNFRLIDGKKESIDRDQYIETGPKVVPIDSNNYRCSYTQYNKQLNEYRIITLGDSSTYGLGVESKESFPFLLENHLNSSDIKKEFKIFNFGYPG
ncbi:MAG: hypothetical protein P9M06_00810, partial [Candidatus Saelkia tenebricola]|nr:hypothetical protein [Candidatus Saelkia tenebricola]